MKAVIVCVSDGNTRRVAEAMGQALTAPVVVPGADLSGYDLVGFGSGIYYRSFHASLREFVSALPPGPHRKRWSTRSRAAATTCGSRSNR
jgi:flavodoxin